MTPPTAPLTAPPVVPRRRIRGASAVLLAMTADGRIDWDGWRHTWSARSPPVWCRR